MAALLIVPSDIEPLLVAGRRAAYAELHVAARQLGVVVNGDTFEQYQGDGPICINGLDLRPMIDAVVIETAVRSSPSAGKPRRPWWRFWA